MGSQRKKEIRKDVLAFCFRYLSGACTASKAVCVCVGVCVRVWVWVHY